MENTTNGAFPFHKLKYERYLIIGIIIYVERSLNLKYMYFINKEARNFIKENFITI